MFAHRLLSKGLLSVGHSTGRFMATFKKPNQVSIFSIPMNLGQPFLGPDQTPSMLVEHGLLQMLGNLGYRIHQVPEIKSTGSVDNSECGENAKNCAEVGRVSESAFNEVLKHAVDLNKFLLILGGDHCIPIGTLPAICQARPNTGVVWVDAHADINTPEVSLSGNMHGMPLGFLLGLAKDAHKLPSFHWFKPCLKPEDIVYIGLRDLDAAEKRTIRNLNIKTYTVMGFLSFRYRLVHALTVFDLCMHW